MNKYRGIRYTYVIRRSGLFCQIDATVSQSKNLTVLGMQRHAIPLKRDLRSSQGWPI
jgi:hypothetical protein